MKYILCVCLLCILLALTGCTAEEVPALPDVPTAESTPAPSASSTPESNPEAAPAPGPEAMPAPSPEAAPTPNSEEAPSPSAETMPAPDSEAAPEPSSAAEFREEDLAVGGAAFSALALSEAEMEALWGPVRETDRFYLVQEEQAEYRYYDGVTVCCTFDGAGTYYLGALACTRPEVCPVRGVDVGASLETVLAAFRDDGDRTMRETDFGPAAVLYGQPAYMQAFGFLRYEDGAPVEVMYQAGGMGVRFFLDAAQNVAAIELLGPLSAIREPLQVR